MGHSATHQELLAGRSTEIAGQIRLACTQCDREDCDGIDRIPEDWKYVDEVQTYEEACAEVAPEDTSRSATDWWTHLGTCPDCAKEERTSYEQPEPKRADSA